MRLAVPLALLAAAACSVGPRYTPPTAAVPPAFAEGGAPGAAPADPARWWSVFADPILDDLIRRGLAQNLDLAAAASRVREARYTAAEARAGRLPQLNAIAGAQRTRISENGGFGQIANTISGGGAGGPAGPVVPALGGPGNIIDQFNLGFDASWEIDLFGGVRARTDAARARAEARGWDRADTAVSVTAEIADTYFQLRVLQRRAALARAELARENRTLRILADRARFGLGTGADASRQRVQIAAAEATLGPIEADGRALVHALGILVGEGPSALIPVFEGARRTDAELAPPPPVPAGLPSDLLRRRPDIRAAERELAAATSDIGVAVADLYPRFTIATPFQLLSTFPGNLFQGGSIQATTGGAISFPFLDFGRRRAVVGQRREGRDWRYIAYQQAVLRGLKETEDALARLRIERARRVELERGAAEARRVVAAIDAQYRFGLTDLTTVLTAQQDVLRAQDSLALSEGTISRQTIALYKALGGGWEALPPIVRRDDRRN